MTINELWKLMRHNIKLLKIRIDVTSSDVLKRDYNDILYYIDNEGDKSIQESIIYYNSHPEKEEKITECMTRYENNFKAYNSGNLDVGQALQLIDFVKSFPIYISYDLRDES